MSAHDDLLTEAQAAALVGWTPANIRSHRERWAAGVLAESLSAQQRRDVLAVRRGELHGAQGVVVLEPVSLRGLRLVREVDVPGPGDLLFPAWELTSLGLEVARRLHRGQRGQEPPPHCLTAQGIRYRRADVVAWLSRRADVREADRIIATTIPTVDAAAVLGLAPTTLRSLRSRALRAQARIDAGRARPDDPAIASACPRGQRVGGQYRYRRADLDRWLADHGRARGPDPLEEPLPAKPGRLLTDQQAAKLMGLAASCLPGYRSRARKALRWLAQHPEASGDELDRQRRRARACPPHVVTRGRRRYRLETVRAWVVARNA